MAVQKIAIVSQNLRNYGGHHYNFTLELVRGLKQVFQPLKIDVIVGKYCRLEDTPEMSLRRLLPNEYEASFNSKGLKKVFSGFIISLKLSSLLRELQKEYDLIIFPDGYEARLLMSSMLCKSCDKKPMFYYVHTFDLIKKSVRKFSLFSNQMSNFFFLTYNDKEEYNIRTMRFLNILERKGAKIVFGTPHPTSFEEKFQMLKTVSSRFTVGYLGAASVIKGFEHVVEFIRYSMKTDAGYSFIVSAYSTNKFIQEMIKQLMSDISVTQDKSIIVIHNPVSRDEYFRLLGQTSVLLLLYDRNYYRTSCSGILFEALAFGKPVIVTSHTWLARQIQKYGGGIVVDDTSPESVMRAVEEIRKKYDKYKEEALSAGKQLLEKHNSIELAKMLKELLNNSDYKILEE